MIENFIYLIPVWLREQYQVFSFYPVEVTELFFQSF